MMYKEFTEISKMEIGYENYTNVIEPMYNAAENMDKFEFVEFIKPSIRKMAKEYAEKKDAESRANQKTVFITDGTVTPNGCWFVGKWAKLVETDVIVRTGGTKATVREMTKTEAEEFYKTHMMNMNAGYDILDNFWAEITWTA